MAKARYVTDDENLVNQIKNFCTHLEVPVIKVYWSSTYYNNVYFVNSYFGAPSMIIGREVYNQLSKNELNSVIYATLLRIKLLDSKHRTSINLITLAMFWWVFYFSSLFENKLIKNYFQLMLLPAFYLKQLMFRRGNKSETFDLEIYKHDSLKREYISALFKINKLLLCLPYTSGAFVLSGLSHTFNISNDAISYLLFENEIPIEKRIKAITGSLK